MKLEVPTLFMTLGLDLGNQLQEENQANTALVKNQKL